jgi:hypothetical protein
MAKRFQGFLLKNAKDLNGIEEQGAWCAPSCHFPTVQHLDQPRITSPIDLYTGAAIELGFLSEDIHA